MQSWYLEIVTGDVDAVCRAYAAANAGGVVAHPPLEIPGHGTFAIYFHGDVQHGLWQLQPRP
jgi:hypothetical protein